MSQIYWQPIKRLFSISHFKISFRFPEANLNWSTSLFGQGNLMTFALPIKICPLVNFTKIFLRKAKLLFSFLLLSLAVLYLRHFFLCYKHSGLTSKIGKRRKTKSSRIDSCCQFHQQFTCGFFEQKFWVHFRFVLFWHKNIGAKATFRMLVKLTPG